MMTLMKIMIVYKLLFNVRIFYSYLFYLFLIIIYFLIEYVFGILTTITRHSVV